MRGLVSFCFFHWRRRGGVEQTHVFIIDCAVSALHGNIDFGHLRKVVHMSVWYSCITCELRLLRFRIEHRKEDSNSKPYAILLSTSKKVAPMQFMDKHTRGTTPHCIVGERKEKEIIKGNPLGKPGSAGHPFLHTPLYQRDGRACGYPGLAWSDALTKFVCKGLHVQQ